MFPSLQTLRDNCCVGKQMVFLLHSMPQNQSLETICLVLCIQNFPELKVFQLSGDGSLRPYITSNNSFPMCYRRNTGSLCLSLPRPPGAWMPTSCTSGGHCFLFTSCGSIYIICHDCHLLICVLQLRVWNPGEPKGKSNFAAL